MAPRVPSPSTQQLSLSTPSNGDYARHNNDKKKTKVRIHTEAQEEVAGEENIKRKTVVETHDKVTASATPNSSPSALDPYGPSATTTTLNNMSSMLGMYGGGGMGMYGAGMMYGGGYGSGMGMFMPPLGGGGPLSSLNQFLFGVQNVIFSLSQAVQIIGMNTHALQNLLEAATAMFDHAVATWHEMQMIEAAARELETQEQKKRRRRLQALRWAMLTAATYAGYRLIRRVFFFQHRQQQQQRGRQQQPMLEGLSSPSYYNTTSPYYSSYPGSNMYNPYSGPSNYYGY